MQGLAVSFEGFSFLCGRPALWQFAVWPILANVIVSLTALALAWQTGSYFWQTFSDSLPIVWWATMIKWCLFLAVVVSALGLALVAYLLLQSVFCAWFFSQLARHVDLFLGTPESELTDPPIVAQISDALRAALKLIIVNVFVLLLHLIPGIGSIAALVIGLYVDAFILGSEFFGYPLELRGIRWRDRQRIAKAHLGATLGLGTVVSCLILIPVVGAAIQATSVVGAVLLFRRINGLPTTRAEAGLEPV
jgi:CysZ protein